MFKKLGFVLRFLYFKVFHFRGLKINGFVFFERDVTIKIARGGRIDLGNRAFIRKGVILECAATGRILIKQGVVIGYYAWIAATQRVEIGVKSLIGNCVTIIDVNHETPRHQFIADSGYTKGETIIGDDCMIGTKVTVNANVKVDRGAIVMANAVVAHDVPEFTVFGGIPARFIKERQ